MKKRNLIALVLTAVLTMTMTASAMASEPEPTSNTNAGNATICAEVASHLESTAVELASMTPGEDYVDGEGVFLADSEEEAKAVAEQYGAVLKRYAHRIAVIEFPGSTIDAFNNTAAVMGATRYVDPQYISHVLDADTDVVEQAVSTVSSDTPNDVYADKTVDKYQYFHEKINTLPAHETTMGKGAKIAVIDTGCTPDHEDSKFDEKHCQYIEFAEKVNEGVDEAVGHGIHCTGIIHEEKGNLVGGYGVAPEAEIYSIQIATSKSFNTSNELEGLQIAINDNVDVISMSLGSPASMTTMDQLIDEAYKKGITVVAAAGNDSTNQFFYPGACDHVICVAASDDHDMLASYSNYGDRVDIVAPGSEITSTYLFGSLGTIDGTNANDAYGCISGTSMATPIVAGVAALCYASNPSFTSSKSSKTVDAIEKILMSTTDGRTYTYSSHSVTGLVQADKAVAMAKTWAGQGSLNYSLIDPAGVHGLALRENIAQGKSMKLEIGDYSGNTKIKGFKKQLKSAQWESSNESVLTVKKGKIKCNKKAALGSRATVTATIGQEVLTCDFLVTEALVGGGSHKWKHNGKLKIISTINVTTQAGNVLDLREPNQFFNAYVYSRPTKHKYVQYVAGRNYNYKVDIPKKTLKNNSITETVDSSGRAATATFNQAGVYKIKFTPIDGSGKSFTFKVKVS